MCTSTIHFLLWITLILCSLNCSPKSRSGGVPVQKILRPFHRGGTMAAAFKCAGVDWKTAAVTAPVAELFIAAPGKYKELLKDHTSNTVCHFNSGGSRNSRHS